MLVALTLCLVCEQLQLMWRAAHFNSSPASSTLYVTFNVHLVVMIMPPFAPTIAYHHKRSSPEHLTLAKGRKYLLKLCVACANFLFFVDSTDTLR